VSGSDGRGDAAAPWRPRDCHAHTTFSDGALAPIELADLVAARGVRPTISDHLSHDVALAVTSAGRVTAYLDALAPLAEQGVAVGGEFCWHDTLWRELPADTWSRFTHTIGSLHAITLDDGSTLHAFRRRWPSGLSADAYMEQHVANLERFAREMPVEILAHPTLLPLSLRHRPLEELWTEPREERAVAALAAAGIAFEISNRYRAHERFVRRAVAAGVRLSLGSDGHTADQVGQLAWPLALARTIGVRDDDLYEPTVHGRRKREGGT
jgi:histidinol phosphatase-like PHP family hydrolase